MLVLQVVNARCVATTTTVPAVRLRDKLKLWFHNSILGRAWWNYRLGADWARCELEPPTLVEMAALVGHKRALICNEEIVKTMDYIRQQMIIATAIPLGSIPEQSSQSEPSQTECPR